MECSLLGSFSDPMTYKITKLVGFHISESPLMAAAELFRDLSRVDRIVLWKVTPAKVASAGS